MMDVAESRGMEIDTEKLSSLMRTPVVPIVARKSEGIHEMMNRALEIAGKDPEPFKISYGPDIDPVLDEMARAIDQDPILDEAIRPRWSALKYLEGDETIKISIAERAPELEKKLNGMAETLDSHLRATLDTYAEALIADHRYVYKIDPPAGRSDIQKGQRGQERVRQDRRHSDPPFRGPHSYARRTGDPLPYNLRLQ
jgi:ferrous iron transport protein B